MACSGCWWLSRVLIGKDLSQYLYLRLFQKRKWVLIKLGTFFMQSMCSSTEELQTRFDPPPKKKNPDAWKKNELTHHREPEITTGPQSKSLHSYIVCADPLVQQPTDHLDVIHLLPNVHMERLSICNSASWKSLLPFSCTVPENCALMGHYFYSQMEPWVNKQMSGNRDI